METWRSSRRYAAIAALAGAFLASSAPAATRNATASVTTVKSLAITKTRDLDFGTLMSGTGGTVTLDPVTGARTTVGVVAGSGGATTARFVGAGTPGRVVGVTYPAGPLTLRHATGTATMTVEALTTNSILYAWPGFDPRQIPANGLLEILIGGVLRVGANQTDGTYSATFAVTIDYY